MLPLSDLQGYEDTLPLSLLYITMILRVRRIFFEITTFPNTNNTAESKYDMLVSSMTIIAHNSLVFYSCI